MALEWGWAEFPRRRRFLLASFLGYAAIHVAAIGMFAFSDPYAQRYRPVTSFLIENVAPGEVVVGRAEIAFEIGFDRVLDDVRLGYHTGKRPRIIVIGDEYRWYFQLFAQTEPDVHAHIRQMLEKEYSTIYSDPYYEVYLRIDAIR